MEESVRLESCRFQFMHILISRIGIPISGTGLKELICEIRRSFARSKPIRPHNLRVFAGRVHGDSIVLSETETGDALIIGENKEMVELGPRAIARMTDACAAT